MHTKLILIAIGMALLGCATIPIEMSGDEPFAVLYEAESECPGKALGASCARKVYVRMINGEPVRRWEATNNHQITPGENSIIVEVISLDSDIVNGVAGICEIELIAEAGKLYTLDRTAEGGAFVVVASMRDGVEVATCKAPFKLRNEENFSPIFVPVG